MTTNPQENQPVPEPAEQEGSGSRWGRAHHVLFYFLGAAVVIWLLSGFYQVKVGQVGMVERLGEILRGPPDAEGHRAVVVLEPGMGYGLPWPLDIVHQIPTNQNLTVRLTEFGQGVENAAVKRFWMNQGMRREELDAWFDPYLITADLNVANVEAAVQYKINDPYAYLMSVSHSDTEKQATILAQREGIIRQVASHELVAEMARTPIDLALKGGQADLARRIKDGTQMEADRLGLGITVLDVTLEHVTWLPAVNDAFSAALRAESAREQALAAAEEYRKSLVTRAEQGESARVLAEADAYRTRMVQEARGEAERFRQVYEQYQKAPDVTRLSMYSDAVNVILQNVTGTMTVLPGQRTVLTIPPVDEKAKAVDRNAAQAQQAATPGGTVGSQQ